MLLRRRLAVLVAFCIALGLAPSAAQAADLALTTRSAPARPGQLVKLRATAPAASTCVLRVDAQRLRVTTPSTQRFVISGRVSRRARPGSHSLSLSCSAQRARTRVKVARSAGNRKARGKLFGQLRISAVASSPAPGAEQASSGATASTQPTSTAPFPRPLLPASVQAQLWWTTKAVAILTSFRNGQCTDWAQQRRPDILQNGYTRRFDLVGLASVVTSWDARHWMQLAQQAGLPVGRSPVVGAIVVYQPGYYGTGSAGHVAVVEAVAADGSFEISQMNAPIPGQVTRQKVGAATAAAMAASPGIAFIL